MMMYLAAFLGFVVIAGLGWVLVGGDDGDSGVKRAKAIASSNPTSGTKGRAGAKDANSPETRRKQIMAQLKDAERQGRKARTSISAKIRQAGLSWSMRTYVIISVVFGIVGLLLPLVLGANILLALGAAIAAGLGLPRFILSFLGKKRIKKFQSSFADAVDVLVRGIKTGLPLNDCFKIIARESPEPLREEFQRLTEAMGVGQTLPEALDRMYERMPTPELNFFRIVIAIQQKTGGNLGEALTNLTTVLRARRMMREKIKAMSSEAVASALIIGSLPPLVMIIVLISSPGYMMTMFTDIRGHFMLLVSAAWMGLGIMAMRKMINFKI
ncbi:MULTISPECIES: type II secretion system F family protein [unclassified Brevundimonas]|uniref:type II secretion system F family protein n=1 Tax=unclassified Brevundimonas TaxID=2622653 RepID=UPI0025C5A937|nr:MULTISPECIES: type II secretion system F family protein [unclassified Brevundimonas]